MCIKNLKICEFIYDIDYICVHIEIINIMLLCLVKKFLSLDMEKFYVPLLFEFSSANKKSKFSILKTFLFKCTILYERNTIGKEIYKICNVGNFSRI